VWLFYRSLATMGNSIATGFDNPQVSETEYRWWVQCPGSNVPTELGINFQRIPLPPMLAQLLAPQEWDQFSQAIETKAKTFVNLPKQVFAMMAGLIVLSFILNMLMDVGFFMAIPFLSIFGFLGYLSQVIHPANNKVDAEIRTECQNFANLWSSRGITIQ
jgi:hypothetical protein